MSGHHHHHPLPSSQSRRTRRSRLASTPFDLDLYEINDGDGNAEDASEPPSPLAAPSGTRLVLGLNKYSHDTTLCAASLNTGEVLFACSKERLTRKKHDGGNTAGLVETCLDQLGLDVDCIERVVMNNHHHRILPFVESNVDHMEWEEGLGINAGEEDGYSDEYNLLSGVENKIELSHHLAHAYSAASQAPFDSGLIVVMDGMGETYRTMKRAVDDKDATYFGDLNLCEGAEVQFVPGDVDERARESYFDWREAESVYTFTKSEKDLNIKVRAFKKSLCSSKLRSTCNKLAKVDLDIFAQIISNLLDFSRIDSRSSSGSRKRKRRRLCTITVSRIWTLWEPSTRGRRRTYSETGMPGEYILF